MSVALQMKARHSGRKPETMHLSNTQNCLPSSSETYLGRELNIKVSWKGFPTTVTSAVSTPSRLAADGYNYHIFSRSEWHASV